MTQDKGSPLDLEVVHQVVLKAHSDLDAVGDLLEQDAALVNASWDWAAATRRARCLSCCSTHQAASDSSDQSGSDRRGSDPWPARLYGADCKGQTLWV